MKRINYTATVDASAQDAKDTIDALESEVQAGNVDGYNVEYRSDVGAVQVRTWRDATVSDLPAAYDDMDAALGNAPVGLPSATDNASAQSRGRGP